MHWPSVASQKVVRTGQMLGDAHGTDRGVDIEGKDAVEKMTM